MAVYLRRYLPSTHHAASLSLWTKLGSGYFSCAWEAEADAVVCAVLLQAKAAVRVV
jgi:hypothetical protein